MSSNAGIHPGHAVTGPPLIPPIPPPFTPGDPLFNVVSTAVPYQALVGDFVLTTSNSVTTPVGPAAGEYFAVKNVGALPVAIVGTVDGVANYTLHPALTPAGFMSVWFVWNAGGATWDIVSDYDPVLPLAVDAVAGANYNFALTDANVRLKSFTDTGAKTATVLNEATVGWKQGTILRGLNFGTAGVGDVLTVAQGAGVTIRTPETLRLGLFSQFQLVYHGSDIWILSGDLDLASSFRWTWANATARLAQAVIAADIGFVGYQQDIARKYELLSLSGGAPNSWGELPDPSLGSEHSLITAANSPIINNIGIQPVLLAGTLTARAASGATRSLQLSRTAILSAGAAGSMSIYRTNIGGGNLTGRTGYRHTMRVVPSAAAAAASMRWFAGVSTTTPAANQDPVILVRALGIGRSDAADVNVQFYHSNAAGPCTKINLGASFPHGLDLGYEIQVFTLDAVNWVFQVRGLNTGAEFSATVSVNVPGVNDPLTFLYYASNNTDAVQVSPDLADIRIWQVTR